MNYQIQQLTETIVAIMLIAAGARTVYPVMLQSSKGITHKIGEILDEISDEIGEEQLDPIHILKFEGWSPSCMPESILSKGEHAMSLYAERQAPKIHREWRKEMSTRGYKMVKEGHEPGKGLYGVTWALYSTTLQKSKTKYRTILEHRDPFIAAADRRQGTVHVDFVYAYSREQAKFLIERRKSGYRVVTISEFDKEG